MIKELCDILTGLVFFLQQAHLCADNKSYAAHLLTENLQKSVNKDIDALKELYILSTGDYSIANAQESLHESAKQLRVFLQNYPLKTNEDVLRCCVGLEQWAYDKAAEASTFYADEGKELQYAKAIVAVADDVCKHRTHDLYLLRTEVFQNGNS